MLEILDKTMWVCYEYTTYAICPEGGFQMEIIQIIAIVLAVVGALNWGLVGLFKWDLVAFIGGRLSFGEVNLFTRVVYILVAIAGLISLTAIGELM